MKKTRVVHCKREPYDVYIGRGSVFGNPFAIGVNSWTRDDVIRLYKEWFYGRIEKMPIFKKKVLALRGQIIGCWCKPKACHGDVIVEYLENLKND